VEPLRAQRQHLQRVAVPREAGPTDLATCWACGTPIERCAQFCGKFNDPRADERAVRRAIEQWIEAHLEPVLCTSRGLVSK
jgi:hypothetical protein